MNSKCVLLGSTKAKPLCQIAINFINIHSQFRCLSHGLAINGYYDTKPTPACLGDTDSFYQLYSSFRILVEAGENFSSQMRGNYYRPEVHLRVFLLVFEKEDQDKV